MDQSLLNNQTIDEHHQDESDLINIDQRELHQENVSKQKAIFLQKAREYSNRLRRPGYLAYFWFLILSGEFYVVGFFTLVVQVFLAQNLLSDRILFGYLDLSFFFQLYAYILMYQGIKNCVLKKTRIALVIFMVRLMCQVLYILVFQLSNEDWAKWGSPYLFVCYLDLLPLLICILAASLATKALKQEKFYLDYCHLK